jgi:hypothetical protein
MSVPVKITSSSSRDVIFDQPQVILVEGADDQAVVAAMIRHENLGNFHVHDMNGNTSWGRRLQAILRQPEFSVNIKALGLVKDADSNPNAAWDSCIGILRRHELPTPRTTASLAEGEISVAVMIVPSMSRHGAIEDLCMASFEETRLACVRGYFECLGAGSPLQATAKGEVQAYLAGLPTAPRDLKVAADRGTLNMTSDAFDELRAFVRALSSRAGNVDAPAH